MPLAGRATQHLGSYLLLVALVASEVVWLAAREGVRGPLAWAPLVAVVGGHGWLVARERRTPVLRWWVVVAAAVVVLGVATALPAAGSRDLYQYAFYGRMVHHFGVDPSVVPPDAFSHDRLYRSLAPGWHGARTVYGPAFTWLSALGSGWFGTSAVRARLWFQSMAAVAALGSVIALVRLHGPAAGISLALSPVMVAAVNGGHNDVLVGALVLAAAVLADRDRPVGSGLVAALATCVKVSALPVVGATWLVWCHRRAWRSLALGAGAWLVAAAAGYAGGGGLHLLVPLRAVAGRTSRASMWGVAERIAGASGPGAVAVRAGGVVALLLVVVASWRQRRRGHLTAGVAAGAVSCFAAPYVLAWYPAIVLPVAATVARSRSSHLVQVGASALLVAYVVPAGEPPGSVPFAGAAAVACGVVLAVVVGRFVADRCRPPHRA